LSGGAFSVVLNQLLSRLANLGGDPLTIFVMENLLGNTNAFGTLLPIPNTVPEYLQAIGPYTSFFYNTEGLPYFTVGMVNSVVQAARSLGVGVPAAAQAVAGSAVNGGVGGLGGLSGGGGGLAASLGQAPAVGKLSVPPAWAGATPALSHTASAPVPVITANGVPEANGRGNLFGGMPLAGAAAGAGTTAPRYGFKSTVMARPPFGG
jgi:hypothetical protein